MRPGRDLNPGQCLSVNFFSKGHYDSPDNADEEELHHLHHRGVFGNICGAFKNVFVVLDILLSKTATINLI